MKTISLIAPILFYFLQGAYAQENPELEKRSGFKDIKLGSTIDSIKGSTFKKDFIETGKVEAKLYEVKHPDYESIGEIPVHSIELKTYKDLVYQITVHTEKDPRLMKAMEQVLGKPDFDAKKNRYFWKTPKLILTFTSISKKELELIYFSYEILLMMKDDKKEKVNDIANDF